LRRGRRFGWREAAEIALQVCRALRHAHDRGIIHRDLKPANLLLAADGRVKLSDFGIARFFGVSRLTQVGGVIGTAEYMSPEQAAGEQVDHRSDLYSLGAVMYALLAGRPPFQGQTMGEVLHKQRFEMPEPLNRHAPDCPPLFQRLIGDLLAKEPGGRVPTAKVLEQRLRELLVVYSAALPARAAEKSAASAANADDAPPTIVAAEGEEQLPPTVTVNKELVSPDVSAASLAPAPPAPSLAGPSLAGPLPPEPASPGPSSLERTSSEPSLPGPSSSAAPPASAAEIAHPSGRFFLVRESELDHSSAVGVEAPGWLSPRTWGLLVALAAIAAVIWHFARPRSADALFRSIMHRYDGSAESLLNVEGEIEEFLVRFPDDPRAEEVRDFRHQIALHRLERRLERQTRTDRRDADITPLQEAYRQAINYVRFDPDRGLAKLEALLELYGGGGEYSESDALCLELARRRAEQLRAQRAQPDQHALSLVERQLAEAERLAADDPRRAQRICQAVIELYGEKPWAKNIIDRARKLLASLP
jgi:serine/threonine-protein kinase